MLGSAVQVKVANATLHSPGGSQQLASPAGPLIKRTMIHSNGAAASVSGGMAVVLIVREKDKSETCST